MPVISTDSFSAAATSPLLVLCSTPHWYSSRGSVRGFRIPSSPCRSFEFVSKHLHLRRLPQFNYILAKLSSVSILASGSVRFWIWLSPMGRSCVSVCTPSMDKIYCLYTVHCIASLATAVQYSSCLSLQSFWVFFKKAYVFPYLDPTGFYIVFFFFIYIVYIVFFLYT